MIDGGPPRDFEQELHIIGPRSRQTLDSFTRNRDHRVQCPIVLARTGSEQMFRLGKSSPPSAPRPISLCPGYVCDQADATSLPSRFPPSPSEMVLSRVRVCMVDDVRWVDVTTVFMSSVLFRRSSYLVSFT